MRIDITARHFELTKALEDHVRERLGTLVKYFESIIHAHVTLSVEKYRHITEIILKISRLTMASREESDNMYSSIDGAVEKLERQVKRYKQKLKNHKTKKREIEKTTEGESEEFLEFSEEGGEGAW